MMYKFFSSPPVAKTVFTSCIHPSVHPFTHDLLSNQHSVSLVASCRALTYSLHFSQSMASLCMVPQLCCVQLSSAPTILHQVIFSHPPSPSIRYPLHGCFINVAGVPSEHMTDLLPAVILLL